MATLTPTGPNAEQIKYWNEVSGPKWVALQGRIDGQIAPLGRRALERAALEPGERVVDVGCGCGQTVIDIAQRVGAAGRAMGIDLSTTMLDTARERATAAGLTNVHFENADAQTHELPAGSYDAVFSRFGVMFFSDPAAAFANLRRALRPGGRLVFLCWQSLQQNPWMLVPLMAAAQHLTLPPLPAPEAPGPFAFADADRVRGILDRAGFADVALEDATDVLTVGGGGTLDETVEFVLQMGPTAAVLREAGPEARVPVAGAIREAFAPFATPRGVELPGAAWVVTGRRA